MKKFLILTCAILFAGAAFAFEPSVNDINNAVKAKENEKQGFVEKAKSAAKSATLATLKFFFGGDDSAIYLNPDKVDITHLRELFDYMTMDNEFLQEACQQAAAFDQKTREQCVKGAEPLKDYISQMHTNAYNQKFDAKLFDDYRDFWNSYQSMVFSVYDSYYSSLTVKADYFKKKLEEIKSVIQFSNDRYSEIDKMVGIDKNADSAAKK
ncbi:MAG: hypothetical protein FWF35_01065 [Elusimicrobia bacterium]|nr:hypothetical protein [Elusimicrobiota bacterium]